MNTGIKLKLVDRLMLTKHLAVMLRSGITLSEALEVLADQTKSHNFKEVLNQLRAQIKNGVNLEKALAQFPNAFDPLYISIVGVGEKSGNLDNNLEYLAKNMAKGYEFRKKVGSALLYPAIIVVAALLAGTMLTLFVLPKMVEMFKSLDVTLPLSTQILVWIAEISQKYGMIIVPASIGLAVLFMAVVRRPTIKPIWHRFLLKIPMYGELTVQVQVASMCRNLGIMLGSGLPINEAIAISAQAADNMVFKEYLVRITGEVEKGKGVGKIMAEKNYKYIPLVVSRMVQVGEKSGKLDESFNYLAEFFEEEVDDKIKNLGTMIEPVMLVAIAVVVGFIAFAIITPIYSLTSGIHK